MLAGGEANGKGAKRMIPFYRQGNFVSTQLAYQLNQSYVED